MFRVKPVRPANSLVTPQLIGTIDQPSRSYICGHVAPARLKLLQCSAIARLVSLDRNRVERWTVRGSRWRLRRETRDRDAHKHRYGQCQKELPTRAAMSSIGVAFHV